MARSESRFQVSSPRNVREAAQGYHRGKYHKNGYNLFLIVQMINQKRADLWLSRHEGLKDFATSFGLFKKTHHPLCCRRNIDEVVPVISVK